MPEDEEKLSEVIQDDASTKSFSKDGVEKSHKNMVEEVETERRKVTGFLWFVLIMSVLSSTFLYALDNTVMANVRPSVLDTFGNINDLPWMSVAYPLGEVGSSPLWGMINGNFDNKKLFLAAFVLFEVGSVLAGAAQSIQMLILGRVISGIGGSGVYVGAIVIISSLTMTIERAKHLNYLAIMWALGTILGPVVGGLLADSKATWRWAFYLNLCVAAIAIPTCVWLIPSLRTERERTAWQRTLHIDYVGQCLFFGAVLSLLMILSFGGAEYSWGGRQMIGLYVATPVIWCLFIVQQRFRLLTVDRIFPIEFFGELSMVRLCWWMAIAIGNLVVTIYTLPLLFQFGFGDSPVRAALFLLPFIGAVVISFSLGGALFGKYPVYMAWYTSSAVLMLVGSALLSTIDSDTSKGIICGYSVILGLGCGPVTQLGFTVAQVKKDKSQLPRVTAFLTSCQMGGLALSLGISTCVFLNTATNGIAAVLPEASLADIKATINGADTAFLDGLTPNVRDRILSVIIRCAGKLFYINVASSEFGLLTALAMPRERLALEDAL